MNLFTGRVPSLGYVPPLFGILPSVLQRKLVGEWRRKMLRRRTEPSGPSTTCAAVRRRPEKRPRVVVPLWSVSGPAVPTSTLHSNRLILSDRHHFRRRCRKYCGRPLYIQDCRITSRWGPAHSLYHRPIRGPTASVTMLRNGSGRRHDLLPNGCGPHDPCCSGSRPPLMRCPARGRHSEVEPRVPEPARRGESRLVYGTKGAPRWGRCMVDPTRRPHDGARATEWGRYTNVPLQFSAATTAAAQRDVTVSRWVAETVRY
jgi:hypothetical protein